MGTNLDSIPISIIWEGFGLEPLVCREASGSRESVHVSMLSRFTPRISYTFARRHSNIELYGTEVAPLVRKHLARSQAA